MRRTTFLTGFLALALAASVAGVADAQRSRGRGRERGARDEWTQADRQRLLSLAARLEADTDRLAKSLDRALDRSRLDGSRREDTINAAAGALENAADQVEENAYERQDARRSVAAVFVRAEELDDLVGSRQLDDRAERDWQRVDADLDALASFFPAAARLASRDDDDRGRGRGRGRDDRRDWRERRPWLESD